MDRLVIVLCILIVVVFGCCTALVILNPSLEEFIQWSTDVNYQRVDLGLDKYFEKIIAEATVKKSAQSYNYIFFSIFTANMAGEEIICLGALHKFLDLTMIFEHIWRDNQVE